MHTVWEAVGPVDILILGASGFIGGRVAQAAKAAGKSAAGTALLRPLPEGVPGGALDVHDQPALVACLRACRPRALVYSILSWDLNSPEAQTRASVDGLRAVMHALRGAYPAGDPAPRLVYLSTNAVFSGRPGPHREDELPDPQNRRDAYRFYGAARRAGEDAALAEWPEALVARTANVDGRDAWGAINPRLAGLIAPLRAGQPLARFVDRVISPTLVDALAGALVEVCDPAFRPPPGRILHLAGSQPATDYAYALRLAARLGVDPGLVREDYCVPPVDISLDVTETQRWLRARLPGVDGLLAAVV
jgi:dTDP-4-dehydrorhamnose reductase